MKRQITYLLLVAVVLLGPARVSAEVINVAPVLGTADQSTTNGPYAASRGIDGDFGNFTHTQSGDLEPFWEVDLGVVLPIEQVTLYNRTSCCGSRLRDITVFVLDSERNVVWHSELLNPENELGVFPLGPDQLPLDLIILAGSPVEGQIVRVEREPDPDLSGTGGQGNEGEPAVLSLGEVEVLVDDTAIPVLIGTQPRGGTRYVGQCHVFAVGLVNAQNAASISYQWQKDGVDIPGATGSRLALDNLQDDDAGVYTVVVTVDGEVLTSEPAELVIRGLNLALYGTATQSTLASGGVPERAIDGNTNGVYGNGSVTHTANQPDSWWQVELFGDSTVDTVVLWNRTDACCPQRLSNFRVVAVGAGGAEPWSMDFFADLTFPPEVSLEIDLEGTVCRTIRVERLGPDIDGNNILSLAEVEVFGDGPVPPSDPRPNLARACGVTTWQSSEYSSPYPSDLAVDGNYSNFTHTSVDDQSSAWEVDLQSEQDIALIVLWNRVDCCQSRLRDITVSILDAGGDTVWASELLNPENELGVFPGGPAMLEVNLLVLEGNAVTGQIVRVERLDDSDLSGTDGQGNPGEFGVLSLAEVEVFAVPEDCPPEGDTHCEDLVVEGPEDSYPGLYTITAFADDDSGDPILYTFTLDDGVTPSTIGPQEENSIATRLGPGQWTISVSVDDDPICVDESTDPTCSTQVDVVDVESIAPLGLASQSTTDANYTADLAIDGNYGNFTHTVVGNDGLGPATWELDLLADEPIGRVVLYNRTSCCGSRLRDITVYILGAGDDVLYMSELLNPENELGEFPLGPPTLTVNIEKEGGPILGRKIRVERLPDEDLSGGGDGTNPGEVDVLSLGEVEVYRGSDTGEPQFKRGDPNGDNNVNISDGVYILDFLFVGGPTPTCSETADSNDDGSVNITDGIYILDYLFLGGGPPPPPGPTTCGPDPVDSPSHLGCVEYTGC